MSTQEPTQEPTQVAPVITSQVKEKSPGRVAAGKRLAEISRVARERKKQEQAAAGGNFGSNNTLFTYSNIFALVGISIGAAALLYESRPKKVDPPPVTVEIVPTPQRPLASGLESFD